MDGNEVKLVSAPTDYKLRLTGTMNTEAQSVSAGYDESTMTYTTSGKSEYYELAEDAMSLTYHAGTNREFQFEGLVEGQLSNSMFAVSTKNQTIAVKEAAINRVDGNVLKLVSAPTDYKLRLTSTMAETSTRNQTTLEDDKYTIATVTEGYELADDAMSITYNGTSDVTLELTGIFEQPTAPSTTDNVVALTADNFDQSISNVAVVSNNGGFTFSIAADDYVDLTFTGSAAGDTINSAGQNLIINAGAGNDSIVSSGKNATIAGGTGNDYIQSTGAGSSISGGNGVDTILGGSGAEYIHAGNGDDSINGGSGADTIDGGADNDIILGGAGLDSLSGNKGNDTIDGGANSDIILGGAGNDSLYGNAGNDTLDGGAGNDTLWGGAGNDTLIGGAGADNFVYKPGEGTDTITDYSFSQNDILQIINADGSNGGYDSATFSGSKLTVAVTGGGSVVLDGVSEGDKININGETKTVSSNGLS